MYRFQYPRSGTPDEPWEADSALGGYYRFKSVGSGKCLNVSGGGTVNGTQVSQYTCGNAGNDLWNSSATTTKPPPGPRTVFRGPGGGRRVPARLSA
ncbi:RICIN domain-containing protein [Streptomyces sp.]|uniref:RICIN domain-containing protein n=1 Tax=Streptomyces sp. TaxID=1931 RepID=UPI002F3F6AD4